MATQRMTVACIGGAAAEMIARLFDGWRVSGAAAAVDAFCVALRGHAGELPVLYHAEWIDRWSMGDDPIGWGGVEGRRFEVDCLTAAEALGRAARLAGQFPEQLWLASRLSEAGNVWVPPPAASVIVVIREVLGGSATDEEIKASTAAVPAWLAGL